ncbi:DUF2512 family protein [Sutcliffiella rhizosphaerae]|uniref:DUF2512 family protein n=1 Tax=Sutcliffiella rhizosphaerae TaxID=2880967 RepID=A0ABN8AII6_9BACI|nr:DUF2512 family protein [Sutcliffiella rhizosphaerae]CAG9622675.1 hypothetical protein BACCIP111883_03466 [Sutcliffiella rhizosphaerae]
MKHFLPVVIKFIASFLVLATFLNQFAEISFWDIILTASVLVLFSYLIGDTTILPRTNYTTAAVFDLVLSFGAIASMIYILTNLRTGYLMTSILAAGTITIFEVIFHFYLIRSVFPEKHIKSDNPERLLSKDLQTEFSEELDLPSREQTDEENK